MNQSTCSMLQKENQSSQYVKGIEIDRSGPKYFVVDKIKEKL